MFAQSSSNEKIRKWDNGVKPMISGSYSEIGLSCRNLLLSIAVAHCLKKFGPGRPSEYF